jgi:hypothetical protein
MFPDETLELPRPKINAVGNQIHQRSARFTVNVACVNGNFTA